MKNICATTDIIKKLKDYLLNGRKLVQILYLLSHLYLGYIKSSYNSKIKMYFAKNFSKSITFHYFNRDFLRSFEFLKKMDHPFGVVSKNSLLTQVFSYVFYKFFSCCLFYFFFYLSFCYFLGRSRGIWRFPG